MPTMSFAHGRPRGQTGGRQPLPHPIYQHLSATAAPTRQQQPIIPTSDRLAGRIYVSPLESRLGLDKLLLPVMDEVNRMRLASLPLIAPTMPSIQESQAPGDLQGTDHNIDLVSLGGARLRRETGEQSASNAENGPASTNPHQSPHSAASSVRAAGETTSGVFRAASIHTAPSGGSMTGVGSDVSGNQDSNEPSKRQASEVTKGIENGNNLAVHRPDPSVAIADKEKKTGERGSDDQDPQASAPRHTQGVDAEKPDDCQILSSPPAAFKNGRTEKDQNGSCQNDVSVQGQRPLAPAGSLKDLGAQRAPQEAPISRQSRTTEHPKVILRSPAQPAHPSTDVLLPPQATHAATNNQVNSSAEPKLTHDEIKRVLDALRQRTGGLELPPALQDRYNSAIHLIREAMIAKSPAKLPKSLASIYQSYVDRILAGEAALYGNGTNQAPYDVRIQLGQKRIAEESVGDEAEKRRKPNGQFQHPGSGSPAMPTGPLGQLAPRPSNPPPHGAPSIANPMSPRPTGYSQGPQADPFDQGPDNVQQPGAAPQYGRNAAPRYTNIAWRQETGSPYHTSYGHEYSGMPAGGGPWPQPHMGLHGQICGHQVPFVPPRQSDVYTSEQMERPNSRGLLENSAGFGSPFASGRFPLSYSLPLKRNPPKSSKARSNGVAQPRKKKVVATDTDPVDPSLEQQAGHINGVQATTAATKGRKQPAARRKSTSKKTAAGADILPPQRLAITPAAKNERTTPAMGSFASSIVDEPNADGLPETADHRAQSQSLTELLENEDDEAWMGMVDFGK
ncbi:MAG: hypothetical protein Q9199_006554 [Rusavskia elegans]